MRTLLTSLLCVFTLSLTAQVDCLGPDFNNDGEIGTADLIAFLSYYGNDWPDEPVADIPGCMDDTSCNYNPLATSDDGSCTELDECGTCGGAGIPEGECDCEGTVLDECGTCGGLGIPEGECDCEGNVLDECGTCGGSGIPEGECDGDGYVLDECGTCGCL